MTEQEIDQIAEKVADKVLAESVVSVLDVDGHGLLMHFTEHELLGSARIIDEDRAKACPCHCFTYEDKDYCFAKGAIGMLTQEQEAQICKLPKVYEVKPGLQYRFEMFRRAAEAAKERIKEVPEGERLGPWLHTMGEELAKRGVKL